MAFAHVDFNSMAALAGPVAEWASSVGVPVVVVDSVCLEEFCYIVRGDVFALNPSVMLWTIAVPFYKELTLSNLSSYC